MSDNILKTLNDIFPDVILGNGIFSEMKNVPWNNDISNDELDIMFFSEYGQRPIAPIFNLLSLNSDGSISDDSRIKLASMLEKRFKIPWIRRYSVLELEYNPLDTMRSDSTITSSENIDFTDNTTDDRTITSTGSISKTGTDTNDTTVTYNTTNSRENSGDITETTTNSEESTDNQNSSTYGFNSDEAVPTDIVNKTGNTSGNSSSTSTDTRKVDETKTGTDSTSSSITYDTTDDTSSNTSDKRTLTKSELTSIDKNIQNSKTGALGVFTNQDILKKELDLWKYDFFKSVFEDIANIICLAIYQVDI